MRLIFSIVFNDFFSETKIYLFVSFVSQILQHFVEQEVSNLNVLGIMHQGLAGELMLNPLTNLGFIIFC